jgi:hypothetical protein
MGLTQPCETAFVAKLAIRADGGGGRRWLAASDEMGHARSYSL